jgi:pilus assembly protein Flp/PilA
MLTSSYDLLNSRVPAKNGDFQMTKAIKTFLKDENGATAIEYGLIAALVAVAIVAALTTLGNGLSGLFGEVNSDL